MPTTFSTEHILYTIQGRSPGGEKWSIGLRTGAVSPPTEANLDLLAAMVANHFQNMISTGTDGIQARNPTTWFFDSVTGRHVTELGITDVLGSPQVFTTQGQAATQYQPDQIAVAVSLLTAKPGRSGRGRVYLPVLSIAGIVNSRLTTAQAQAFATDFAVFLDAIKSDTTVGVGPFPICIQSRKGPGVPPPVNRVQVGDVFDTQRRRRDKLVENYASADVV